MATYREASPEQAAFLTSLVDAGLLLDTGAPGLLGQGPVFDDVREALSQMATILRFNNLKIAASEQAPRVCQGAMSVCGIVGYKNDTPFSVGRHLRDTMSACLMVANDRIHQTNASLLLIAKEV